MENKELNEKLTCIWNTYQHVSPFKNEEMLKVLERNYCYAEPSQKGKTMVVGFNPSYGGNDDVISYTLSSAKHRYFTTLRKTVLSDAETTYLDLFYFKYTEQSVIEKLISEEGELGLAFMVEQLELTKQIMEDSKPKLILVMNKGAWAYFGYYEKYVWMGYTFEEVSNLDIKEGKLMRITGFRDSHFRLLPKLESTNLIGTYVYFSRHLNRVPTPKKDIITNEIKEIRKNVFKG